MHLQRLRLKAPLGVWGSSQLLRLKAPSGVWGSFSFRGLGQPNLVPTS